MAIPPEECPYPAAHGNPFRYCPNCSWMETPVREPSPIMRYFSYAHLPHPLNEISREVYNLATEMESSLADGPEKSAGLRKLLEAKDCFVRAALKEE